MKTLLTLFLLLFSSIVSSFDNKKVLFENEVYRLSLNYNNNCERLNLFDKKNRKNISILDRLNFLDYGFNLGECCNGNCSISWDKSFDNNYNYGFLVLNYDLVGYIDILGEKPKKHVEYYCSVLDLATGDVLTKENSNDGFCKMERLHLPDDVTIKENKALLYNQPNKVSNKYLIKGDKVKIFYEYRNNNEDWYFINYKGKKEINMWIKADSVDVN